MTDSDVVIIGAGAAGMMCAIEAGKRGKRVVLLDHADTPGEKIRISGGGRCNFTNLHCSPANFISNNPHFCKSALSRYTQHHFIDMVKKHGIPFHEKILGQLFCDKSAKDIITMLTDEMTKAGVDLYLSTAVQNITYQDEKYKITTGNGVIHATSLVIATGGLSIPKMGATGFAYDIARQFGLRIVPTRAGLVPLLFSEELLATTKPLSGLAVAETIISTGKTSFREAMLFTHKGLSGPAVLQISSYWQEGQDIKLDLAPDNNLFEALKEKRQKTPRIFLRTALRDTLPHRLADMIADASGCDAPLADLSNDKLLNICRHVQDWRIIPTGTEGYRTAEVTIGGIDTDDISSKTFECKNQKGLYFVGEALDVTGHLGGFNFQWAWSSGWCAGQYC